MPYSMTLELQSTRSYLDFALVLLSHGWSPCFEGSMFYVPVGGDLQIEEACDPERLLEVLREKENHGEELEFLVTHLGLQYCCSFNFLPDHFVVVGLSGETFVESDVLSAPDFSFYFESIVKPLLASGKEILAWSFDYQR